MWAGGSCLIGLYYSCEPTQSGNGKPFAKKVKWALLVGGKKVVLYDVVFLIHVIPSNY